MSTLPELGAAWTLPAEEGLPETKLKQTPLTSSLPASSSVDLPA
uniref:Uncharacterized protein n=1 Tax=Arundo donax TaxID=35708 RepID=A0A0A9AVM2_ARUDO